MACPAQHRQQRGAGRNVGLSLGVGLTRIFGGGEED